MRVDEFDFDLPPERIALRPVHPRDSAKLLIVNPNSTENFADGCVADLPNLLREGDAVVFNDTKVIPAELHGQRDRNGSTVEVSCTLIRKIDGSKWQALAKPARRLREGDCLLFKGGGEDATAVVKDRIGGQVLLEFDRSGTELTETISTIGNTPLPPYISARRKVDERDRSDYQTLFARIDGSVAAPTAGLHFTENLLQELKKRNVSIHYLTLHVGAGTFLPVKVENTENHDMHEEWGEISAGTADSLNNVRKTGGRILAVGTTVLRLLESAVGEDGNLTEFKGGTSIFITPGYRFQAIDLLLTNFHLPKSTLFMLVSAFSGLETMKGAYKHAIARGYRFYSYGDCSLLYPKGKVE